MQGTRLYQVAARNLKSRRYSLSPSLSLSLTHTRTPIPLLTHLYYRYHAMVTPSLTLIRLFTVWNVCSCSGTGPQWHVWP